MLLLPHISEKDAQETLTVVNRQSQRLTTLVSDLLLLSRLDSKQRPLVKSACCSQDLISDIVEEMAAFAIAEEIALAIDFQTQTPVVVVGDEEQLYRLVLNLVNNAIPYTQKWRIVVVKKFLALHRDLGVLFQYLVLNYCSKPLLSLPRADEPLESFDG